jgi:hypothetical protein
VAVFDAGIVTDIVTAPGAPSTAAHGDSDVVSLGDVAVGLRRLVPMWRGDEVDDVDVITTVENAVISTLR